jgi:aldehyde:ferredoxin oxidoreductase
MTERLLHVDLTSQSQAAVELDEGLVDQYLGGGALGWRLAYETIGEHDAYAPENPIILSCGALVGTVAPGASKITGTTRFPTLATEDGKQFVGSSVAGGRDFGVMMRAAGWPQVIITGKAESPLYLLIDDEGAQFLPAGELWGKLDAEQTAFRLKDEHGSENGVLCIGPAGENLVRFGMAFVDLSNSLGRSGLGAVFGSKNVKAIVVRGTQAYHPQDTPRFLAAAGRVRERALSWPGRQPWSELGMGAGWPIFKYTQYPGRWPRDLWERCYGEPVRRPAVDRIIGCSSCAIACRIKWRIPDGEFKGEIGMGSPFGKSATSGQLLDITDQSLMLHLVALANRAGLCFYTFTRLTDWLTTLYRDGVLRKGDTEGLELRRDYDTYVTLLKMVTNREGIGAVMAEGWNGVAGAFSIDPHDYWYAGISKGVDFIYDARAANLHPLMFSFITNPRPHHGGLHTLTTGRNHSVEAISAQLEEWGVPQAALQRIFVSSPHSGRFSVGRYTRWMEDAMAVRNALGVCSMYSAFGMESMGDLADMLSALRGREYASTQLLEAGARAFTAKRALNVRSGFGKNDDQMPGLWMRPMNSPEGSKETMDYYDEVKITPQAFRQILDEYYEERGWDGDDALPRDIDEPTCLPTTLRAAEAKKGRGVE